MGVKQAITEKALKFQLRKLENTLTASVYKRVAQKVEEQQKKAQDKINKKLMQRLEEFSHRIREHVKDIIEEEYTDKIRQVLEQGR